MIDATLIVRTVQDSRLFQLCNRHRWLVLFGVLLFFYARNWLAGDYSADANRVETSTTVDAKRILAQVSRELQTTTLVSGRADENARQMAEVVNTARRLAHRAPLAHTYEDPITELAVGQCMAVSAPGDWPSEKLPDNCRAFVRREFNLRQSMVDGLATWIGDSEYLATIIDPTWNRVGGWVEVDGGSCVICLILAK